MFTVPMRVVMWSAYRTGFCNECVIPELVSALTTAGLTREAATLEAHWARKVRAFVDAKADLFKSEYPFDSTAFESTQALARSALDDPAAMPEQREVRASPSAVGLLLRDEPRVCVLPTVDVAVEAQRPRRVVDRRTDAAAIAHFAQQAAQFGKNLFGQRVHDGCSLCRRLKRTGIGQTQPMSEGVPHRRELSCFNDGLVAITSDLYPSTQFRR